MISLAWQFSWYEYDLTLLALDEVDNNKKKMHLELAKMRINVGKKFGMSYYKKKFRPGLSACLDIYELSAF